MSASAYLYQLIGQMFGGESDVWLDTPNPDFGGVPPRDLVDRRQSREKVLRYLENMSTDAAIKRTQAFRTDSQVGG